MGAAVTRYIWVEDDSAVEHWPNPKIIELKAEVADIRRMVDELYAKPIILEPKVRIVVYDIYVPNI